MATHKENQNPNPSLPDDLIYNILSTLPVKTLLRFRSVCKSWLSLISSSSFIKTHLSKSTNDPYYTNYHGIFLCDRFRCHCFGFYVDPRTCSLYPLFDDKLTFEFDIDDQGDSKIRYVVGYCNGLVCLACGYGVYNIYLWNPATRSVRKLPKLDVPYFSNGSCCGFCYDELNDTFKVYSVYKSHDSKYEVSVYSSESNCWRLMGDFPFNGKLLESVCESPAIFANGALHWVVFGDSSHEKRRIVSLDINTDMYREILLPKYREEEEFVCHRNFRNFSNSLSMLCTFDNRVDLWICGEEDLWTKLFTVPFMDRLKWNLDTKLICVLVNGDIMLLYDNKTILLYNSKDSTFDELLEMDFKVYCWWHKAGVYTYVESLVSPQLEN